MSNLVALGAKRQIPFANVFLDPNNPRVAPDPPPGYEGTEAIFDREVQDELTKQVYKIYNAEDLERAIVAQGWTPIDPIMVWKHPEHDGYITVEGNTRVSVLRNVRAKLPAARDRLAAMEASKKYKRDEVAEQRRLVQQMEGVVADTEQLEVQCVNAVTAEELDATLPKLLGVRHILGTRNWTPYARNLYVLNLYERAYALKHGPDAKLEIDKELIRQVGDMVSLKPPETRQAIQAANAFGHFRRRFEDQVEHRRDAKDESGWKPEDQYYLVNILENKYARDQFGFDATELRLSDEMEEVLLKWAFMKDPPQGEHVFRKAEDFRVWQSLSRYDARERTAFASLIDVNAPDEAVPISELKFQRDDHKRQRTPVNTLKSLLDALTELPAEKLHAQASSLGPMLAQIAKQAQDFLDMIGKAQGAQRSERDT